MWVSVTLTHTYTVVLDGDEVHCTQGACLPLYNVYKQRILCMHTHTQVFSMVMRYAAHVMPACPLQSL